MTELDRRIVRADRAAEACLARELDPAAFIAYAKEGGGPWPRDRESAGVFRGRTAELASLVELHGRERERDPGRPVLLLVHGKPGVGKSVLARELARRLAPEYPDGTCHADLDSNEPRPPAEILRLFLADLGQPEADLPRFRSLTHGRRILILLDAARDHDQVRQVLPTGPGCAVIVTSRCDLGPALGAPSWHLDVPPIGEALAMLSAYAGTDWVAEAEPAAEVVGLCGRLPLAIRAAGERVARDGGGIGDVAEALRPERTRLDWLGPRVRRRIGSEYPRLGPREQRALGLLAFVESATFAAWVLGPLLGVDEPEAERAVAALVDAQLVDTAGSRYRLDPLVSLYARSMFPEGDDAARERLDDAYLERAGPHDDDDVVALLRIAVGRGDGALCRRLVAHLGDRIPAGAAVPAMLAALDLGVASADPPALADALLAQSAFLVAIERYREAFDVHDRAVHIGPAEVRRQRIVAHAWMCGQSDPERRGGDVAAAEADLRAAYRVGDARSLAAARYRLARLHVDRWRSEIPDSGVPHRDGTAMTVPPLVAALAERAVVHAVEAVHAFRAMGNDVGVVRARCVEIRALVAAGRIPAAERLCQTVWRSMQAAELRESPARPVLLAHVAHACGELLLHTGHIAEALRGLDRAVLLFARHRDADSYVEARTLRGNILRRYRAADAPLVWDADPRDDAAHDDYVRRPGG